MRVFGLAVLVGGASAYDPDPKVYTDPKTTELGCDCKEPCTTGVLFDCDVQPICAVKSQNCAKGKANYSVSKLDYYDWCVWPKYTTYESMSAKDKFAYITGKIAKEAGTSGSYPSGAGLAGIFTESVSVSFDAVSDVFTQGSRTKYIHSEGTVAPFKFVRTNKNAAYTGLFEGADYGLIRFSAAVAPSKSGYPPGAGIKFFRDGVPSANFMAMPSLDNQPCTNQFFSLNFTNHVTGGNDLAKKLLASKFWQASFCPKIVGLSDIATFDQKGQKVSKPVFPWHVNLVPAAGVHVDIPCDDYKQGMKNFESLTGKVFDVYAAATPKSDFELIGYYELTGKPQTSQFGDESLFFKHQYQEDDFVIHPEWLQQIDKVDVCGMDCAGPLPPTHDHGCTSPFPPVPVAAEQKQPCPFARLRGLGANDPCPHDLPIKQQ